MRAAVALTLLALSFALLVPGVTRTILVVDGHLDREDVAGLGKEILANDPDIPPMVSGLVGGYIDGLDLDGRLDVYHQERSIWSTVRALFRSGDALVGFLIMLFSVIVPVAKGLSLLSAAALARGDARRRLFAVSGAISKWSMADVFVVAIFVAHLAANAAEAQSDLVTFEARFGSGFYCFLGYCLLSIVSSQLLRVPGGADRARSSERV